MDRRTAIKCSLMVTAGIFLVPSCTQRKTKPSAQLKNIYISMDQENLLADLSETIIPKTASPGAKDLSSHLFALMMVDDCFDPESQKGFLTGMSQFEDLAKNRMGSSFSACTQQQKDELLKALENKNSIPDVVLSFYSTMKRLTIQSFTTSKYYLTKIHVYEMVPGRFHGCVPVAKNIE